MELPHCHVFASACRLEKKKEERRMILKLYSDLTPDGASVFNIRIGEGNWRGPFIAKSMQLDELASSRFFYGGRLI